MPLNIEVPISHGELWDKITILTIKQQKITNEDQLKNITYELDLLTDLSKDMEWDRATHLLVKQLKVINELLWQVEEEIRGLHDLVWSNFDWENDVNKNYVLYARKVYQYNDERASIKKLINELNKSTIIEEKSYGENK
jgi:hypothetical protein